MDPLLKEASTLAKETAKSMILTIKNIADENDFERDWLVEKVINYMNVLKIKERQ